MDTLTVAYHELGHALTSLQLDIDFDHITVVPEEESLGHVLYFNVGIQDEDFYLIGEEKGFLYKKVNEKILTCLAGPAAEMKFTGQYNYEGAGGDLSLCYQIASKLRYSDRVAEAFIKFKKIEADSLFTTDHGEDTELWEEIVHLAPILLERKIMTMDELMDERRKWLEERKTNHHTHTSISPARRSLSSKK